MYHLCTHTHTVISLAPYCHYLFFLPVNKTTSVLNLQAVYCIRSMDHAMVFAFVVMVIFVCLFFMFKCIFYFFYFSQLKKQEMFSGHRTIICPTKWLHVQFLWCYYCLMMHRHSQVFCYCSLYLSMSNDGVAMI